MFVRLGSVKGRKSGGRKRSIFWRSEERLGAKGECDEADRVSRKIRESRPTQLKIGPNPAGATWERKKVDF